MQFIYKILTSLVELVSVLFKNVLMVLYEYKQSWLVTEILKADDLNFDYYLFVCHSHGLLWVGSRAR